jgi:hypothetical protein
VGDRQIKKQLSKQEVIRASFIKERQLSHCYPSCGCEVATVNLIWLAPHIYSCPPPIVHFFLSLFESLVLAKMQGEAMAKDGKNFKSQRTEVLNSP